MSVQVLRGFQEEAVKSGVGLFETAKSLLDSAGADAAGRRSAINHNGYLLIEAPTGSGKTLMAGTILERFSHEENVVWFWFAPFKGVVGQTAAFLRDQFHGLRLRELSDDRSAAMSRRGDVFVTTWQTVATRVKDKRNVRKDGETNPSIDTLAETLREQGLRIGVVVDEAHHGFREGTQAAKFFREVLKPEYSILITATPDDADIKAFEKAMGIVELQRIRVSRADAVDSGLIKTGVKCAAYFVEPEKRSLVDLEGTALRDGVLVHRKLKQTLADMKVPLVPLLLVQAGSKERSIEKLKDRLLRMGFADEQIAVHTAEEPDADLLALANDEKREVLIFKMAVALGFDAPRACTLVSMRASRDPEFGVQLVGRILRVHRRLQGRAQAKTLPDELAYGYVFLSDAETQTGLDKAGQLINQIQTEYAKASAATVVVRVGEQSGVSLVDGSGQVSIYGFPSEEAEGILPKDVHTSEATLPYTLVPPSMFDFELFFGAKPATLIHTQSGEESAHVVNPLGKNRYALRPGMPRRFKTQVVCPESDVTEEDCAQRFMVSTRDLFEVMRNKIPVEKRTLDVFEHTIQQEFNFAADLSATQAAEQAQAVLCRNKTFDPRELRRALLRKLEMVMREEVVSEADDPEKVVHFLDVILATHPELLYEAQKAAHAQHAVIQDAEELPAEIVSPEPLPVSPRNVYGVMPEGLNSWEKPFAELMDRDANNVVAWWHRNPPLKPWSVNVLMPDGRGFFPDFVIGINGRKTEDNVLLADPKLNFQRDDEAQKVLAEHRSYGRVMILFLDGSTRWMTVGFDQKAKKPIRVREFRLSDAAGF
ncbi:DEAD/DEAH box helicase [Nitrospira lenta]|uniref:DNA/RNA helicase, superfamily II n=1 Tax=Nitrospira lenta TaxID=1436998 RepID=A0A330LC22_9BACT|nr:DEAD/DEAH box helicase family protein [Nitrospira lenta]SPP66630.1 DNA/RNA helicase, superfamily II [Nitrospira lenta]